MIRAIAIGLLFLGAGAGAFSPAHAAPTSFALSGSRAKECSLSATSVGLTLQDVNHQVTPIWSPSSVTAWCNAAGTLSVSSTRIRKGTTNTYKGWTLTVTGWGSTMTYVTTATTTPAATTQASAVPLATTLSLGCSAGCTDQALGNNTTWSATITLALSPN